MHSDPIADFIIRIKNGYMAHKKSVDAPYSKVKEEIGKILVQEGYVEAIDHKDKTIVVKLSYNGIEGAMQNVTRVSKPGLRVYVNKKNVPSVLKGRGIAIVSTSQGLMTDKQARTKGLGGELIAKIW